MPIRPVDTMTAMVIERHAMPTLTPVEMDPGDELLFTLYDGRQRRIVLKSCYATVTQRGVVANGRDEGVLRFLMSCTLEIDGLPVSLVRSVPSQENFRAPPQAMGLRLWLDAVDDVFTFLEEKHGPCRPGRKVRLAVWDERSRVCPVLLHPWCPLPEGGLRIEQCYRGEDTWLGPYDGNAAHGGLDINHPAGTPLWTPLHIHEHELFNRVNQGANNNRWRGLHHWPHGSTWVLQAHHMIRLLVPEDQPIEAGTHYAEGSGVLCGSHEHSHFVFRIREHGGEISLDPWLLFWQMYEDRRATAAL
jgi:hypothetical protein